MVLLLQPKITIHPMIVSMSLCQPLINLPCHFKVEKVLANVIFCHLGYILQRDYKL